MANRWYTKRQACEALGIKKENAAQLRGIIKSLEAETKTEEEPGMHRLHLLIDADAIDSYTVNHRDPEAGEAWEIKLQTEMRDAFLANANTMKPKTKEAQEALAAVIKAITEAKNLTQARRAYAQSRKPNGTVPEAVNHLEG